MTKNYVVYKATNIKNEKSYIGFDSRWPLRKKIHEKAEGSCPKFHNAIIKHGKENFKWEILFESTCNIFCLNVDEPFFIDKYNTIKNGYNITKGGEGVFGLIHNEESKKKMSSAKLGFIPWNKGKKLNDEHKRKLSKAKIGYVPWNKNNGLIYQIFSPTGKKFITKGLTSFCKKHNLSRSCMARVSLGERKHHKGWTCKQIPT
jgi:group I intron endonuclease